MNLHVSRPTGGAELTTPLRQLSTGRSIVFAFPYTTTDTASGTTTATETETVSRRRC